MTEKDIEIQDEETLNEAPAEDTDKASATEENATEETTEEVEEKDPLEKAQDEIADLKDKWLRSVAEFENYRKRTLKERAELILNGGEKVITAILKTLESQGVSKIETKDADFDTDLHEAVAMVPGMGDNKKGKVIDCLQEGYKLNDKVIRHAKVAVGQ